MGMTIDNVLHEEAWLDFHGKEVMRTARLTQCIYLFVEGKSEEISFPILFDKVGLNLEELGVVIANYNISTKETT